jgi:hypothetical protein
MTKILWVSQIVHVYDIFAKCHEKNIIGQKVSCSVRPIAVVAATKVATRDHKVILMKKARASLNQPMCAGPMENLAIGPRNTGPREKPRWARPKWLKRRKAALC